MYHWGYMYPRLGTPVPKFNLLLSYGWPKFALKGQIMLFLKSVELGQAKNWVFGP